MGFSFVFIFCSSERVAWWFCTDGSVWIGHLFYLVGNIVSNGLLKPIPLKTWWLRAGDFGSIAVSVLMRGSLYLLVLFFLSLPPTSPLSLLPPSWLTVATWVGCLRREVKCGKLNGPCRSAMKVQKGVVLPLPEVQWAVLEPPNKPQNHLH